MPLIIYENGKIVGKYKDENGNDKSFQAQIPPLNDNADLYNLLNRITSYNVCYTKLLRSEIRPTTSGEIEVLWTQIAA